MQDLTKKEEEVVELILKGEDKISAGREDRLSEVDFQKINQVHYLALPHLKRSEDSLNKLKNKTKIYGRSILRKM